MISLIIRSKNEERWIVPCLKGVVRQQVDDDIEIILVDNNSTDKTVEKAINYFPEIQLVNIDKFVPGLAINEGIRASKGDLLVCLSAHCIPAHHDWLQQLKNNFQDDNVAGVYGRQIPMESTNDLDKRDLLVTFGRDRRVQLKDPFFHNANSMFRRDIWEKHQFDEKATNIEDRIWGSEIIDAGFKIIYEPEAQVYHHHGIHQSRNIERCSNIVRIMEEITTQKSDNGLWEPIPTDDLEVTAFIPWKTSEDSIDSKLAKYSIDRAVNSKHINKVVVLTDNEECKKLAESWGAWVPFLRPEELSLPSVRLNQVLDFSLHELEKRDYYPDIIVLLEMIYPLRRENLLDVLVEYLLTEGADTAIAGFEEFRPCWSKAKESLNFSRLDDFTIPMKDREPLQVGLPGLGCATFPEIIRQNRLIGDRVGVYEVQDRLSSLEIRCEKDLEIFNKLKNQYFSF